MTRLEQIEYRLNYLLSQYNERRHEPGFRLQISVLAAERKRLLATEPRIENAD